MRVEIHGQFAPNGKPYYEWDLWDGPDGIEHVHGFASDIISCFTKILEWQERIAQDYTPENDSN